MIDTLLTEPSSYMYQEITPIIPDINLEELIRIENKLKKYTSGNNNVGLNKEELEQFLNWVTYNARRYAVRFNTPIPPDVAIQTESMTGQCAPTQSINVHLLKKLNLNIHPFNIGECIDATQIPLSDSDKEKIDNGWYSPAVRHSISILTLPILMPSGNVSECIFLLDPTFRQFCLKENNCESSFTDENWLKQGHVAPHPTYFMTKKLCETLIQKGYIWLSPRNAKLYGDAFRRSSIRQEFQKDAIQNITGERYLKLFYEKSMDLIDYRESDEKYTLLPSEIYEKINKKKGIFNRFFGKSDPGYVLPEQSNQSKFPMQEKPKLTASTPNPTTQAPNSNSTPIATEPNEIDELFL